MHCQDSNSLMCRLLTSMMIISDAYKTLQCDRIVIISWQKVSMDYQDGMWSSAPMIYNDGLSWLRLISMVPNDRHCQNEQAEELRFTVTLGAVTILTNHKSQTYLCVWLVQTRLIVNIVEKTKLIFMKW